MRPLIPYFDATNLEVFGNFTLKTPGVLVVLGMLAGAYVAIRKARRDDLQPELIFRIIPWLVVGIFVGGHLGSLLFYYPNILIAEPASIFRVWKGLSSFGGFIMCTALGIWFFRRERRQRQDDGSTHLPPIDIWAYADIITYGFTMGWVFGRMGCFSVHDHPGVRTEFWLGVYGICPSGVMDVACHDLGFYEGIWSLVFFVIFAFLDRNPRFPGFFVGVLMLCYGPSRFVMDMLRHPEIDARYFGLTPAQYGSIALIILGMWVVLARRHSLPIRGGAGSLPQESSAVARPDTFLTEVRGARSNLARRTGCTAIWRARPPGLPATSSKSR